MFYLYFLLDSNFIKKTIHPLSKTPEFPNGQSAIFQYIEEKKPTISSKEIASQTNYKIIFHQKGTKEKPIEIGVNSGP